MLAFDVFQLDKSSDISEVQPLNMFWMLAALEVIHLETSIPTNESHPQNM